jgi:hypothetical protein
LRSGRRKIRYDRPTERRLPLDACLFLRTLLFFFTVNTAAIGRMDRGTMFRPGDDEAGVEREIQVSTLGQPHMEPAWKQEVNRRLAAHRNRKGTEPAAPPAPAQHLGSSRAAEAAARVAARYAHAPSYSQMQAEGARVAVRAAEIATQVALEAQAAAEDALAELHAAAQEKPLRGPAVVESIDRANRGESMQAAESVQEPSPAAVVATPVAEPGMFASGMEAGSAPSAAAPASQPELRPVAIRWDEDFPVRVLEPRPAPREEFQLSAEDWWTPAQVSDTLRSEPITVEAEPAHANLIEFPRELVATRRMRPRLAETPFVARPSGEAQLSIFEVDPGAVSTDPPQAAVDASAWTAPEWSGMELDEHPAAETAPPPVTSPEAPRVMLAPPGLRLMSKVVDASLVLAGYFGLAMYMMSRLAHPPAARPAEVLALGGLVIAGCLYHATFFALGLSTPGMRYAGIALSTFDDLSPTRAQMRRRLSAMLLSLAPVGLGFAWSIFDEDHLAWHDRISQTYLRKR